MRRRHNKVLSDKIGPYIRKGFVTWRPKFPVTSFVVGSKVLARHLTNDTLEVSTPLSSPGEFNCEYWYHDIKRAYSVIAGEI